MGGAVCLDFVNTLDDRPSDKPKELLESYIDLARFGEDAGILEHPLVDQLIQRSYPAHPEAARVLKRAIELREAMYAVFAAIMNKKPVPAPALLTVNQFIRAAADHARLEQVNGNFEWRFDAVPESFDAPLWPIARSAADLLASDQLGFIRMCASKTCRWMFLDTSKNHRRRWCDMKACGNRAKFQRFYNRKKASG
jgi:predicted RNA-binding Zn ribbon-like protein